MRASAWLPGLWFSVTISGCGAPPLVERGGNCHSLSDCEPGLTCVALRCSDDISSLMGQVPTYEAPDAAAQDAALDAEAGAAVDAAHPASDAASVREAAVPDSAAPAEAAAPEAAAPDTSAPADAEPD